MSTPDLPCGVCAFDAVRDSLIECRAKSRLPKNAQSILMFLFPYLLENEFYQGLNISKYAVSADYHKIVGDRLAQYCRVLEKQYPDACFEPFCDNSPIPEVRCAALAGLGCIGENGLLIHPEYGSYVFIGEIVTTQAFPAQVRALTHCAQCGKCRAACPTGALHSGQVEKLLCLSDISQRKGELTQAQAQAIRNTGCAWGCDICQNVCLHNAQAQTTPIAEFREAPVAQLQIPVAMENRAYAWRGEKVITRNLLLLSSSSE